MSFELVNKTVNRPNIQPNNIAGTNDIEIGGVIAFHKSFTNTPVMADNFVECNGQAISDVRSPFNGQNAPPLNGTTDATKNFLVGATTSGTVAGVASHNLAHNHSSGGTAFIASTTANRNLSTALGVQSIIPYCFDITWVMRIW